MNKKTNRGARRAITIAAAISVVLALPGAALAQQAGAVPGDGVKTDPVAAPTTAIATQSPPVPAASGGIETVVVTARHSRESAQNVPIAMSVVTPQAMTDLSLRDIMDVEKVSPGLFISSIQVSGEVRIGIRGQSATDQTLTGQNSIGYYVDGVSYPRTYGLRSSMEDLERIEVLKGPQGTLFGKNTTGGALNVTTQHPTYDLGGYVDALFGSYDNTQLLGVVNVPIIDKKLAMRLVVQGIHRDGFYREFDGQNSNEDNVTNGRLEVRADPAENVRILLSGDHVRQRDGDTHVAINGEALMASQNTPTGVLGSIASQLGLNPNSAADRLSAYNAYRVYYDAQQNNPRLGFGNYRNPKDTLDHYGASADIQIDFGGMTAKSLTAHRKLTRSTELDLDGMPFDLFDQRQSTTDSNFSQEFQLSSNHGVGLDWQAGLYYSRENGDEYADNEQNVYVNPNRALITESGIINSSKAAYAQAVYNFTPTLRLTGGIRYTQDSVTIDSKNRDDLAAAFLPLPAGGVSGCNLLTPALGGPVFPNCSYKASTSSSKETWLISTDWRPIKEVMLYGSVSTGYRAGGFSAPGSSKSIASVAASDAAFTPYLPESVTNYEAGFKADLLNRRLRVNASVYNQEYKNIQVRQPDFTNGVLITEIRNAAKAQLYGGELEVNAAVTDKLNFTAGAAYLHANYLQYIARNSAGNVVDLSSQPFASPKWTANLGAVYRIPLNDGSIRLNANYAFTGTTDYAPTVTADSQDVTQTGYGLLDARISWNIDSQNIDIAFFGKNLGDKLYRSSAATAGIYNIISLGDPRTFGFQIRKTF